MSPCGMSPSGWLLSSPKLWRRRSRMTRWSSVPTATAVICSLMCSPMRDAVCAPSRAAQQRGLNSWCLAGWSACLRGWSATRSRDRPRHACPTSSGPPDTVAWLSILRVSRRCIWTLPRRTAWRSPTSLTPTFTPTTFPGDRPLPSAWTCPTTCPWKTRGRQPRLLTHPWVTEPSWTWGRDAWRSWRSRCRGTPRGAPASTSPGTSS